MSIKDKKQLHYWLHAINVLQDRSSQSKLWGLGVFICMMVAFAISSIILVNSMVYTETNLVMVEKQPLLVPIMVNGILVSLFLALLASISVSREIDKGTLETLLYGPVDEVAYISGIFIAHIKIFTWTLIGTLVWANICIWILNLSFNWNLLVLLIASFIMAAEMISFGLCSAVIGGKTRNALIYFILIILFIAGIQISDSIVTSLVLIQSSTVSDPMIAVRNILSTADNIIKWISPFSQVQNAMQASIDHRYGDFFLNIGLMIAETAALMGSAVLIFKKKGVRGVS